MVLHKATTDRYLSEIGPSRSKLERSDSFKSSKTALLDLSVQLVRLLPSTSDSEPPERNILDSEATLFVAFSKFFQPDFSTLFTTTESKETASRTSLPRHVPLRVC